MKLAELRWPAVKDLPKETPVVLPIAAHEQHGHHLPLHTDSILLQAILDRAELRLSERILFAPLQWLGNSHHHLDFPGTLSAEPRLYLDLLRCQLENLLTFGFHKLVLLNGHGGNRVPGAQAVFELRQAYRHRTDLLLLMTTYWENASTSDFPDGFLQSSMGHACEWETSMMLVLRPDLVGEHSALPAVSQAEAFPTAIQGETTKDRTVFGHIGAPAAASPEKGETLLRLFTDGVIEFLRQVDRRKP